LKILVAEESVDTRQWIQAELAGEGNEVLTVGDGWAAWEVILSADPPQVVLLDADLPGLGALELCRKARGTPLREQPYLVLLLHQKHDSDVRQAREAGADDYVRWPLDPDELSARVSVGRRVMRLQAQETARTEELYCSLLGDAPTPAHVNRLAQLELLPVCAWCNSVRSGEEGWQRLERYLSHHGDIQVTHGICPDCMNQMLATPLPQSREAHYTHHLQAS
jgi:CheY-like chemotaxis protein